MAGFKLDTGKMIRGMDDRKSRTIYAVERLGYAESKRMEQDAKRGAKWRDITHRARDGITGDIQRRGTVVRVSIAGNVNYFKYLEYAMQKRWAILWPTIEKHKDEFLKSLGGLWK